MLSKNVFWFKSTGHKIQAPMFAQSADGQFSQLEFLGASVLKDSVYLIDLGSLARCAGIYSCQFLPIFLGASLTQPGDMFPSN